MVSRATLLHKLRVFVTSFADLINSLISSSFTYILFSCKFLVVTLSKSAFSSVTCLLKMSILIEEDNKLLSQYSLLTTSFSSIEDVNL